MPGEVARKGFGEGDPEVVADALSHLIMEKMWRISSADHGGKTVNFRYVVIIDELTKHVFENNN